MFSNIFPKTVQFMR